MRTSGVDAAKCGRRWSIDYTVTLKDNNGNVVTVPAGSSVAVAVNWSGVATAGGYRRLAIKRDDRWWHQRRNFTVTATDDYLKEGSES